MLKIHSPVNKPTGQIELFDPAGWHKYLNGQEQERFRQAAIRQSPEVRTLCLFLYWTGCRISEALAVTHRRIDGEGKAATLETLKKRRSGVYLQVPLPGAYLDDASATPVKERCTFVELVASHRHPSRC
jgi:integrase